MKNRLPGRRVRLAGRARSYGIWAVVVQAAIAAACMTAAGAAAAQAAPRLVVLGDSLTTGLGLPPSQAFPARLAAALKAKGIAAQIADAGVSGDTAAGGLARLDWSVPDGTHGVIVALGGNDMLRGVDSKVTRDAIDGILKRLSERRIPVLLAGMRAAPNLGADYVQRFDAIFPELAKQHGVLFHPFFLDGVADDSSLNQRDGIHPSAAGVEKIVAGILPKVEELLQVIQKKKPSG